MTLNLGNGKQVVLMPGRMVTWANRGCLGVELTPDQMQELGLAMFIMGRRAKKQQCQSGAPS